MGNGEDNMAVPAVDQLFFNGGGAIILIGRTASAAESGMATKRNKAFAKAARAFVQGKPVTRIAAG